MMIKKMNDSNIDVKLGLKIQRKLRDLLETLIYDEMTRVEIRSTCVSFKKQQDKELFPGFWPIIASKAMPSDAAVDFLHMPTHYVTMILMRAFLMNIGRDIDGFDECFRAGLLASIKSRFVGHGYESREHQLDMVKLLIEVGVLEFIDLHSEFCPEFTREIERILDSICSSYDNNKTRGPWGEDYTDKYKFIVDSVRNYNLKVFVYGTLMIGECNHHYLDGCPVYGDAQICGYEVYDTGYGYPAIIYSEDRDSTVDGELYGINSSVLKHLDYLEDNEDMYTREFVVATDSLGHKHLALVYKYNYPVNPNKKIESWKKKSSAKNKVWYVSYGSNLCYDRFMKYINSCSDISRPECDKSVLFGHEFYFAKESVLWEYMGTAFIDPEYNPTCKTIGRMYLISEEQFEEVKRYEGSKYQNKVDLGDYNGIPMVSFTDFERAEHNEPHFRYISVVKKGITELFPDLDEDTIEKYITRSWK